MCDPHDKDMLERNSSQGSAGFSLLNLSFESDTPNNTTNNINHPVSAPTSAVAKETLQLSNSIHTSFATADTPLQKPQSRVPTEPEARKIFIQETAGLLRKRVQTAMKTIDDHNAIDRRVRELEIEAAARAARNSHSTTGFPSMNARDSSVDTRTTLEGTPRAANESNDENQTETDNDATPTQRVLHFNSGTEAIQAMMQGRLPEGNDPIVADQKHPCAVERMIALAKQERAVDGLLQLMKTTTEFDNLDEWKSPK
ncbi:hypothetical protein FQN57_004746 [Myotisia sp. PD_48]|nr:hypothetical protein FQN57_004746 [Myotisia sp. PD_48]